MPKIKTNRTAYKKFRVTKSGRLKRAQANTSHNTAKRSPKRMRNLRKIIEVSDADQPMIRKMLPYN